MLFIYSAVKKKKKRCKVKKKKTYQNLSEFLISEDSHLKINVTKKLKNVTCFVCNQVFSHVISPISPNYELCTHFFSRAICAKLSLSWSVTFWLEYRNKSDWHLHIVYNKNDNTTTDTVKYSILFTGITCMWLWQVYKLYWKGNLSCEKTWSF